MYHSLKPKSPNQHHINKLLDNKISYRDLIHLCEEALSEDLTQLTVRLFDMEESKLLKQVAVTGGTAFLNKLKNKQRTKRYEKKIQRSNGDFRKEGKGIVVLAEGDSWFNYPLILSDVIDWISMEPNIALFSLAEGADWLINMLNGREYVSGLSIHDPDYLLLSGGGNDIVGLSRIAVIVSKNPDPLLSCYKKNEFVQRIMSASTSNTFNQKRFDNGLQFLNKDFFALLMLFKVQYHFIIGKLIVANNTESKYPDLKILTQGYDFVIPDDNEGFGINIEKWYVPLLRQINHGKWLKFPLLLKGISNAQTQKDILYTMIFLFNEMLISVGEYFYKKGCVDSMGMPRVMHIDCRGKIKNWTDELHPQPRYFKEVAELYIQCIKKRPTTNAKPYIFS